jgi:hypothetical protein
MLAPPQCFSYYLTVQSSYPESVSVPHAISNASIQLGAQVSFHVKPNGTSGGGPLPVNSSREGIKQVVLANFKALDLASPILHNLYEQIEELYVQDIHVANS